MKKPIPVESASTRIDEKIIELNDWRGKMLSRLRALFKKAEGPRHHSRGRR